MDNVDYKICHECGAKMTAFQMSKTISLYGKEIGIKGINGYKCYKCGETVYPCDSVDVIQGLIISLNESSTTDIIYDDTVGRYFYVYENNRYELYGNVDSFYINKEDA